VKEQIVEIVNLKKKKGKKKVSNIEGGTTNPSVSDSFEISLRPKSPLVGPSNRLNNIHIDEQN